MASHKQGSILDPMFFNVFINVLFYFVKTVPPTNYADNNTISYANKNLQIVKLYLKNVSDGLL